MSNTSFLQFESATKSALVVDDGAVERLAGKTMLEKLGFLVTTAESGEQALQLLSVLSMDLVLCDISMPGMGGLALLAATRSHVPPPMFIMSTTFDDAEHAVASLRSGASGYLTKPLRLDRLRDTVADAQAQHRLEQNSARLNDDLARKDTLTDLMNKRAFADLVALRMSTCDQSAECGAVLLVKLRGLNHINISSGRGEGDKLLKLAANSLAGLIRSDDLLARYGGDTFALHISGISHNHVEDRAILIGESIADVKTVVAGDAFNLALVIGGACAHGGMAIEDLLNRAEFALHLARERSRNRIRIYSEADEIHKRELSHQLTLLAMMRTVLKNPARLQLHYQPIIDLSDGSVSHFEALLRIRDDRDRLCNAGELVKICEVFGLIGELDRAVIATCLAQVPNLPDGAGVAINLSGKSIGDPALLLFIETLIASLNIDPTRLIFELTETAAFDNLEEVQFFMRRIKSLGCRFALDDFGVGFSSFYYIKQLAFDFLKLDGSFISNLPRSLNDQVFVRAMVEISRVFGLKVIAEWVEDKETADLLVEYGVEMGQGYYFGKPLGLEV